MTLETGALVAIPRAIGAEVLGAPLLATPRRDGAPLEGAPLLTRIQVCIYTYRHVHWEIYMAGLKRQSRTHLAAPVRDIGVASRGPGTP